MTVALQGEQATQAYKTVVIGSLQNVRLLPPAGASRINSPNNSERTGWRVF